MLVCLTGIPASGKSTWAKQFCANTEFFRVSSDDIRYMLYGEYDTISPVEFDLLDVCVCELLKQQKNVVVDATNLKAKHRAKWASVARMEGHEFEVRYFNTNIATCLERNGQRCGAENYVPSDVIVKMSETMEVPHSHEGNLIIIDDQHFQRS